MQAQREFPASLNDVKDKFLVQYCPVGPEVKEVGADTFENSAAKDVRQTKLRVVLVSTFGFFAIMCRLQFSQSCVNVLLCILRA
jgi:hypothetical protein